MVRLRIGMSSCHTCQPCQGQFSEFHSQNSDVFSQVRSMMMLVNVFIYVKDQTSGRMVWRKIRLSTVSVSI